MKIIEVIFGASRDGIIVEADIDESEFNKMDVSASRFMTHEDDSKIISGDFILFEASCFVNGVARVKFESIGYYEVEFK